MGDAARRPSRGEGSYDAPMQPASTDVPRVTNIDGAARLGLDEMMALAASAPVGLFVGVDPEGLVLVNDQLEAITGRSEAELLGAGWLRAIHPDDRSRLEIEYTHDPHDMDDEHRILRPDGSVRWVRAKTVAVVEPGTPTRVVGTVVDITEMKVAAEALRHNEARFRGIVEHSFDAIVVIGPDGAIRYASPSASAVSGFPKGSQVGRPALELVHPDDRAKVHAEIAAARPPRSDQPDTDLADTDLADTDRAGSGAPFTFRSPHADGHWLTFEASVVDLSADPAIGGVVLTSRDVTFQRSTEAALRSSEARLVEQASILEMIATAVPIEETLSEICRMLERRLPQARCTVLLADPDLRVLRYGAAPSFPQSFLDATGDLPISEESTMCGAAATLGTTVVVADVLDHPVYAKFADLARANHIRGCWSTPIRDASGARVLGTFAAYLVEPRAPGPTEVAAVESVAALAAIAIERHDVQSRLADLAHHDSLTGLPNRNLFGELLEHALRRARRSESAVAVLFLDLDRFKIVNDSRGHDVGDELLEAVAGRLEVVLRPGDVVARFGGDEFTVLCEDLEPHTAGEQAISVADRLIGALRESFTIEGDELFVGVSIGIAVGITGLEPPDALLRDADAAMYLAKDRGRGRCEVFDEGMREQARERSDVENALHRAVAREEFRLFFQPVIELATGRCIGVEALARWQHPERGLLGPRDFLRSAEETGLVVPIGEQVLDGACRKAVEWLAVLPSPDRFQVSVNLSSRQLLHVDLPDLVGEVLLRTELPPGALCIEITEGAVLDEPEEGLLAVKALKALGVRVSVDDFGTGYSALGYLRDFPIDEVKIDRSFIARLGSEPEESAIVAAVVSLGHGLGVTVTGEGVETAEQVDLLRTLGVDAAQGFFFAPPQPAIDLTARLRNARPWI